jgi:hypothetical protein
MKSPDLFPALGGDDALGMKRLSDAGRVALGIELGIGQHAADSSVGMGWGGPGSIGGGARLRRLPRTRCTTSGRAWSKSGWWRRRQQR